MLLLTSLCKKLSKNLHFSFSLSSSPRRRVWIFDVTSKVQRHITQLFCYCSGSHHCFSETKLTQVVKLFFYTTIHIAADIAFSRHTEYQAQTHLVLDNFFKWLPSPPLHLFWFLKPILFTFAASYPALHNHNPKSKCVRTAFDIALYTNI